MSDDKAVKVTVLSKTVWSPTLFSFKTTRPDGFRFDAGQFVRLGIEVQGDDTCERVFRAYSVASSPYDEFLEFFSVVVPDGAFTSRLQHLKTDDTLYLNPEPFGFLTLSRYQLPNPDDLWLLATGTGLAPFLSILKTLEVWERYRKIVLVYSTRTHAELAYTDEIIRLKNTYGADGATFSFIPIVTREPQFTGLKERLPYLIESGVLEQTAGLTLNPATSHIMLCGNPQMIDDTKTALKNKGLTMNRRGEGNIAVENYW